MAKIYYDSDADLGILKDKLIGVVGYGNQGRAQSLNMRDSGLEVIVGNPNDDYHKRAIEDGMEVTSIREVASIADVLLILLPDEVQPKVYESEIAPVIRPGSTLCWASGYNIHYKRIQPSPALDVVMVAPRMIGDGVRRLYKAQAGFPCLVGVAQDATEYAQQIALAIAKAIGATRIGAFESSFREETIIDLFAEQMLWPGITKLCMLYFEKLVENGCDPEIVATELHLSGEMVEIARAMITHGFFDQLKLHSHTSQYGQLSRADRMAPPSVMEEIDRTMASLNSGEFAKEWAVEQENGLPTLTRLWENISEHPLAKAEAQLRELRSVMARFQES